MKIERLRAKSWADGNAVRPPESIYLPVHLRDVHGAAVEVLDCTGDRQLLAVGLAPQRWRPHLDRVVRLSAALHDLGKANNHFQGMIHGLAERAGRPQGLRHEWVTLLLIRQSTHLREWLAPAFNGDRFAWLAVECAITGHHPGYNRESPPTGPPDGAGEQMSLLLAHSDFAACVAWISNVFGQPRPPPLGDTCLSLLPSRPDGAFFELRRWWMSTHSMWERLDDDQRAFVAAAKACLIACDVAGSALRRAIPDQDGGSAWIRRALQNVPTPDQLGRLILDRLTDGETGAVRPLRPFQIAVGESASPVTFVKAGCGTGKTLAAYQWAYRRFVDRRLYVCYPTTGTATEGFRDYLFEPESQRAKHGADLFHSRADIDWEVVLGVREESAPGRDDATQELDESGEVVAHIRSLEAWSTPIVCCTVDTVLGLIQNHRRGLFAWPALAQSAFVFDEIHAYDDRLFGALLRFLARMRDAPTLLMTASLPAYRRKLLEQCLARRGLELRVVPGPRDLEELPRYHRLDNIRGGDPLPEVRTELEKGGKVLWVCNTVERAMRAAERAESARLAPILYHSRFRYLDRVERHRDAIDAFRALGPALAICTQVAEMSLDLSATLLVTDLAPVPALIQRLGRLNRRAPPSTGAERSIPTMPFIVIQPQREDGTLACAPYDAADFETSRYWLEALPTDGMSQADLARAWEQLEDGSPLRAVVTDSAWLDGGPVTQVLELRASSPGITVLLESDAAAVRQRPKQLASVTLSMPPPPKSLQWKQWPRCHGVPIAPTETVVYSNQRGARWRSSEE